METLSALLATVDSPHNVLVTRGLDVSLFSSLIMLLKKQLICRWFQIPLRSCDVPVMPLQ